MDLHVHDWLNLLIRWTHLIAGISWIGSSFYFMWLDAHLAPAPPSKKNVEGELWMVHSGGFYIVERKRIAAGEMPDVLHWFKWEATFTWLSGFVLLFIVYYTTGGAYLIDAANPPLNAWQATALGLALLPVSWFVYDVLYQSRLGRSKAATAISSALLFGVVYGLCHVLSGRGAFIHVGAMFGTLMVLNVWVRILPAQQQMIDATKRGETPDFALSGHAKRRSVHNTYMTFPVLFIMLSNHYPMTYGNALNWLVLTLLIIFGASVRHYMVAKNGKGRWALIPSGLALAGAAALASTSSSPAGATGPRVPFSAVRAVVNLRCVACHSPHPTDATFGPMPAGVNFEDSARIKDLAARIKERVVVTKTMPILNKTGVTEEERAMLGRWIDQGAALE